MNDKNETAFPTKGMPYHADDTNGMTLRDYFAAKVIGSWFNDPDLIWSDNTFESAAQDAYKIADAMLKERKKEQS